MRVRPMVAAVTVLLCSLAAGQTVSAPASAAAKDLNPLYAAWKGQENKSVTFTREETISGGAPAAGGGPRAGSSTTVTYKLDKMAADKAVVKVTRPPLAAGGDAVEETL